MRRKDRERDRDFGLMVIDKAPYGVLSMVDEGLPYSIPLSQVRLGDYIYFHGAGGGRKKELFDTKPRVSLVFVTDVRVADKYSNEDIKNMENPGKIISKVYTTEFASAICTGTIEKVLDPEEKKKALRALVEKHMEDKLEFFDLAMKTSLDRTWVWKLRIEDLTAKAKYVR